MGPLPHHSVLRRGARRARSDGRAAAAEEHHVGTAVPGRGQRVLHDPAAREHELPGRVHRVLLQHPSQPPARHPLVRPPGRPARARVSLRCCPHLDAGRRASRTSAPAAACEGITSSGSGGSLPLRRSTRPRLMQAGAAPQVPPAPEGLVHAAADVGVGRDHRGGRPALAVARGLRAAAAAAAEPGARPSAHAPLSSAHRRHLCPAGPGGFGRGAVPHAAMLA